jgi:hypothetical protein
MQFLQKNGWIINGEGIIKKTCILAVTLLSMVFCYSARAAVISHELIEKKRGAGSCPIRPCNVVCGYNFSFCDLMR